MTATGQEVAAEWVEQWRAFCAGNSAPLREDIEALHGHGRVRIHGRQGGSHAATFVRSADGAVVLLGTGEYAHCVDASVGALDGRDPVWDGAEFRPPAVLAQGLRRLFSPVDGETVVGALQISGAVVLLGAHRGGWALLYHDGRRTEWLGRAVSPFDLDAWLKNHPSPATTTRPTAPAPVTASPPTPATPPSPLAASPSPAPSPTPPAPPLTSPTPRLAPPSAHTPSSAPPPPAEPPPAALSSAERRRQAHAAQKEAELREQQRQAAQRDVELRQQQRRIVVGPDPDPEDGPSDSDATRACLLRLPDRAPAGPAQLAVGWFVSILISLGEIGYFGNLCGRKGDIAATLTRILGVPICAKMLGVALTALCQMRSCLVDLANKKRWTIKLDGLAERTHPHHQALLAETGAGFQLRPVKVAFRGRRAVRWEVPRRPLAGAEVFVPETTGAPQEPEPDPCLARATAEEPATSAASPPKAGSAAGSVEAQLRHQLTVAHGLMKLARERQEEERVAWQRAKAELERQVAAAEARAQAAVAELASIRDQNDALTTRIAALELTTRQIVVGLADKLERAMAALAAAIDQQEAERRRRAAEAERHAGEVERLGRQAEELRRRLGELTLERDHYAAEAAHRGRLADEQRRRERLIAERDSHAVDAALAPSTATHPRVTDDQANEGDERATPGELAAVGTTCVMVTCVAWTLATLTFAAAHRRRAQSSPAHGTSHPGRAVARRRVRPTAARLPWIGSAECIGELGVQGPRGPPAWRG